MRVLDPGLSPKDREDVQTRMFSPDVLDVQRFGQIRFHSTAVQRLEGDRWLVHGDLELHGQIRSIAVSVARENGRYKGSTTLRQSEFAITPISIAGGTVKVKDEIAVDFDIVMAVADRASFRQPLAVAGKLLRDERHPCGWHGRRRRARRIVVRRSSSMPERRCVSARRERHAVVA